MVPCNPLMVSEGMEQANKISGLRQSLKLTQAQFGQLFGVHPMTVSKWERGQLSPNPYQRGLMVEFAKAATDGCLKDNLAGVLMGAGFPAALRLLLDTAKQ